MIPAPETESGIPLDARGCAWSPDEARLAWCAGTKVFVRDLATGKDRLVSDDLLAALGGGAFAAQTRWLGDRLLVTLFEDLAPPPPPDRHPPSFGGLPGERLPPPDERGKPRRR